MAERVRPQNRPRSGHDPTICRTRPGFRPAQPFGRQAVTADWSGRSGRKRRDHWSGRLRESWGPHLATKPIVSKPVGHDHKATIGPSQPLLETGSNLDVKKQSQPQPQQQPSPGSPGWQPSVALQAGNPAGSCDPKPQPRGQFSKRRSDGQNGIQHGAAIPSFWCAGRAGQAGLSVPAWFAGGRGLSAPLCRHPAKLPRGQDPDRRAPAIPRIRPATGATSR